MRGTWALLVGLVALVAAGMLLTGRPAPAEPATPKALLKWEYKAIDAADLHKLVPEEKGDDSYERALTKLGAEGWELVAVVKTEHFHWHYFKRPK
jgi:hypothetical protein